MAVVGWSDALNEPVTTLPKLPPMLNAEPVPQEQSVNEQS